MVEPYLLLAMITIVMAFFSLQLKQSWRQASHDYHVNTAVEGRNPFVSSKAEIFIIILQNAEYPTARSRVFRVLFIMGRFYLDIFFNCHLLYGIELANPNP